MTEQNNGGPAFPRAGYDGPDLSELSQDGMTLRDYFAAHAPEPPKTWHGGDRNIKDIVSWRWYYADQMLETRK